MSESPEPTLSAILAAVEALAADVAVVKRSQAQAHFTATQNAADISVLRESQAKTHAAVQAGFDNVRVDIERLRTDEAAHAEQVRADIAGVKADTAFVEGYVNDVHEAVRRHIADPNSHRDAA